MPVVFVKSESSAYAVAWIDGKLLGMRQVASASGARYCSVDGPDGYQLWTKGDTAFVSMGRGGQDTVLFRDCTARH